MTVTSIIGKLDVLLNTGVTTEAQVVYLMAAVRKLLEQRPPDDHLPNLRSLIWEIKRAHTSHSQRHNTERRTGIR